MSLNLNYLADPKTARERNEPLWLNEETNSVKILHDIEFKINNLVAKLAAVQVLLEHLGKVPKDADPFERHAHDSLPLLVQELYMESDQIAATVYQVCRDILAERKAIEASIA